MSRLTAQKAANRIHISRRLYEKLAWSPCALSILLALHAAFATRPASVLVYASCIAFCVCLVLFFVFKLTPKRPDFP